MLGEHPEMYGLPETGLFTVRTMKRWLNGPRHAGLLRCVAELFFGEQTEESIVLAGGWLRRRQSLSTVAVFDQIATRLAPCMVIEKTPAMVSRLDTLQHILEMYPHARFFYICRHPRGYGRSVMNHMLELAADRNAPPPRWLEHLRPGDMGDGGALVRARTRVDWPGRDPQWDWLRLHENILGFLKDVPADQQLAMRGEDLLVDPDHGLRTITTWLGLRSDDALIDAMKHPERGPYSFIGPANARFGTSRHFLRAPQLRPDRATPQSLDGPLEWRGDGAWFAPEIRRLAQTFGYT